MRIDLDEVLLSAPELRELQMDFPRGLSLQRTNTVALHRIIGIFNDRLRDFDCALRLRLEPAYEPRPNSDPRAPNRLVVIDSDVRFRVPLTVMEQALFAGDEPLCVTRGDKGIPKLAATLVAAIKRRLGIPPSESERSAAAVRMTTVL